MRERAPRRSKRLRVHREIKDRLIQTRVPEDLESALKNEAKKRRLSVSHLIRNVLEDTFHLVDGVVVEVDNIVQDSMGLAARVGRDAGRIASHAFKPAQTYERERGGVTNQDEGGDESGPTTEPTARARRERQGSPLNREVSLEHILAWNKVLMNRDSECAKCGATLPKGGEAHLGLSQTPGAAPTWMCGACIAALQEPVRR
jgi:hypothetical protein